MPLLIRWFAPDGRCTERELDGVITVGRGAGNSIQLPGMAVALNHARITQNAPLVLRIECISPLGMEVGGAGEVLKTELGVGAEASIGGHRLRCSVRDDGSAAALEVHEAGDGRGAAASVLPTDMAGAGLRMRRPAIILGAAMLFLGLLVPLLLHGSLLPRWAQGVVPNDAWFSPGRLSNAHAAFGLECHQCHEGVVQRIPDEKCLACHRGIAAHSDHPAIRQASGYAELRCRDCHQEHQGEHGVLPQQTALCTSCHARPSRFPAFPELAAATDFTRGHPPFRALVSVVREGQVKTERAVLTAELKDDDGLYFSHEVHLDHEEHKDGRGIRSDQGREVLQCASCHQWNATKSGFLPIRYERDCQSCHQLDVDFRGLPFRLPHGDGAAVRKLLAAAALPPASAADTAPGNIEWKKPGAQADRGDQSVAMETVDEIFSRRVCGKCHETVHHTGHEDGQSEGATIEVVQPRLRQTWFTGARFTHARHQWVPCAQCHAAEHSTKADDLLLPDISGCRSCHTGVASNDGIASPCSFCHRFHQARQAVMGAGTGEFGDGALSVTDQTPQRKP